MFVKEKEIQVINGYLKPKLKDEGFKTTGKTWWKDKGDFYIVINMQDSQYNNSDELSFCFNIGIALTKKIADPRRKKITYYDTVVCLREDSYLTVNRNKHKFRLGGWLGYLLTKDTNIEEFINQIKNDFEIDIFPKLNNLNSLDDCLDFYGKVDFWGDQLRMQISELNNK